MEACSCRCFQSSSLAYASRSFCGIGCANSDYDCYYDVYVLCHAVCSSSLILLLARLRAAWFPVASQQGKLDDCNGRASGDYGVQIFRSKLLEAASHLNTLVYSMATLLLAPTRCSRAPTGNAALFWYHHPLFILEPLDPCSLLYSAVHVPLSRPGIRYLPHCQLHDLRPAFFW